MRTCSRVMEAAVRATFFSAIVTSGCKASKDESPAGGTAMKLEVSSPDFREGETIPTANTADGRNASPALHWQSGPKGTKSYALICDDPDAPAKTWVHWVLFNLPADEHELPAGVRTDATLASGARQGKNDFGKTGYGGPSPPPGKPHHYHFKIYALDTTLDLAAGATKAQLVAAMKGHVLAEGELVGVYGR